MSTSLKLTLIWIVGFAACLLIPYAICYILSVKTMFGSGLVGCLVGLFCSVVCVLSSNGVTKS